MNSNFLQIFFLGFLSKQDGLLEQVQVELDALEGVVVSRNWVGDDVGVAVRVDDGDRRDADLRRISDGLERGRIVESKLFVDFPSNN